MSQIILKNKIKVRNGTGRILCKEIHESVNGTDKHTDILTHRIQRNKIFYRKFSIVNISRHSFICITISIRAVNVHLSIE